MVQICPKCFYSLPPANSSTAFFIRVKIKVLDLIFIGHLGTVFFILDPIKHYREWNALIGYAPVTCPLLEPGGGVSEGGREWELGKGGSLRHGGVPRRKGRVCRMLVNWNHNNKKTKTHSRRDFSFFRCWWCVGRNRVSSLESFRSLVFAHDRESN